MKRPNEMKSYLPGVAVHCTKKYNVVPDRNKIKTYITSFNLDFYCRNVMETYLCFEIYQCLHHYI